MEKILVPTDGSDHALKAIDIACDLAHRHGAKVMLCHVLLRDKEADELHKLAQSEGFNSGLVEQLAEIAQAPAPEPQDRLSIRDHDPKPVPDELLTKIGEHLLERAQARSAEHGVSAEVLEIEAGPAAERIVDLAKRREADAIIMGSRGLRAIQAINFGSISQRVSLEAPCTCVTVK